MSIRGIHAAADTLRETIIACIDDPLQRTRSLNLLAEVVRSVVAVIAGQEAEQEPARIAADVSFPSKNMRAGAHARGDSWNDCTRTFNSPVRLSGYGEPGGMTAEAELQGSNRPGRGRVDE